MGNVNNHLTHIEEESLARYVHRNKLLEELLPHSVMHLIGVMAGFRCPEMQGGSVVQPHFSKTDCPECRKAIRQVKHYVKETKNELESQHKGLRLVRSVFKPRERKQ